MPVFHAEFSLYFGEITREGVCVCGGVCVCTMTVHVNMRACVLHVVPDNLKKKKKSAPVCPNTV